jgi:nitrate/nitrite transporter NarK
MMQFLQTALGYSPLQAGLRTLPWTGAPMLVAPIAGVLADRIGAPRTILFGGLACIAAGAWFTLRLPRLRELVMPIYVERGILAAAQLEGNAKSL